MKQYRMIGARAALLALATSALTGAAAPQSDWLCQAKNWESSSIAPNWFRNRNDGEDIFRLRILGPSKIRITGSDLIRNGDRSVVKKGSRYVFTDRVTTTNQYGFSFVPRGIAYFDTSNGEIRFESTGAKIMGVQKYHLIFGNCE